MVLAVAYDDAKVNKKRYDNSGYSQTPMLGSRDNPNLPLASLNEQDPGRVSSTHFHIVDQFQVILNGGGTVGRHKLAPYGVHFTRAYTPYGPLVADAKNGLRFFVMRAHPDTGSQRLPKEKEQLDNAPNRDPWQATVNVTFPPLTAEAVLQEVPGIKDDRGLSVHALNMKPNSHIQAPDPSQGDGQYIAVVKGSALHNGKEHKAPALLWVWPKDGPLNVMAGAEGLEAIVLNYPRPRTSPATATPGIATRAGMKKWQCLLCAFSYDEALGMPEEGVPPGTRWQDVPESWSCPDCGATKSDFHMVEV
jgi:rubredoxin